jgi:WD40 repeat protein
MYYVHAHCESSLALAISENGDWVVSGRSDDWDYPCEYSSEEEEGRKESFPLVVFNPKEKIVKYFKGHTDSIRSVGISDNGEWIVSSSYDGSVRLWNCNTGECITQKYPNQHMNVAISGNGEWIVFTTEKTLYIWERMTGHIHKMDYIFNHIKDISINYNGTECMTCDDYNIQVWDLRNGDYTVKQYENITHVTMSPSGDWCAFSSIDTVYLWNRDTDQIFEYYYDYTYSLSINNNKFVIGTLYGVEIWDLDTFELDKKMPENAAKISSNGRYIVTGNRFGQVIVSKLGPIRYWSNM